jgi:hypothetical protein
MPIARADIKFGLYSDFLDRTLAAEDERLPGESIEDGVIRVHDALERAAAILKKRVQQNNGPEPVRSFTPQQTGPSVIEIQTERSDPDDTLFLIQNAPTLEVLTTFKLLAGKDKDLYAAYNQRVKELYDQPREFTDGL